MPPKARTLLDLLQGYEGPLTADFQRAYSLRLIGLIETRTYSEIVDLIEWLPAGSAFHAARIAKGDRAKAHEIYGWDRDQSISLGILNVLIKNLYVLQQVNSPKKIPEPSMIDGPLGKTPSGQKKGDAHGMAMAMLKAQKGV